MKATLLFLMVASPTAFCISQAKAASADTNGFRLTVELQDGARLVGKAGDETYQFQSEALFYLNRKEVAQTQWETPMPLDLVTGDFWIGRRMPGDSPGAWSYNKFFSGLLDELCLYNRALSADEIQSISTEENNGQQLQPPIPNIRRPEFYNRVNFN